jgi:hypothetical protein
LNRNDVAGRVKLSEEHEATRQQLAIKSKYEMIYSLVI